MNWNKCQHFREPQLLRRFCLEGTPWLSSWVLSAWPFPCLLFSLFSRLFSFFSILSSRNMLLFSMTLWIKSRQQVGVGASSLRDGTPTPMSCRGGLLGPAQQQELTVLMVWLLWASLCQKGDVLSDDTKRMTTTLPRDNSVIWPDSKSR